MIKLTSITKESIYVNYNHIRAMVVSDNATILYMGYLQSHTVKETPMVIMNKYEAWLRRED